MIEFEPQPSDDSDNNIVDEAIKEVSEATTGSIIDGLIQDALTGGRRNIPPGCVTRAKHDGSVYLVYAPEELR
jgi:hypothetical protein